MANRTPRPQVELQALLAITVPLAAAYLAELAMMFIDVVVVGRLGSVELAAVGLANNLLFDFLSICKGSISIVSVLVVQVYPHSDCGAAGRWVRQALWIATALSVPGMLLYWFLGSLLRSTGQDEKVIILMEEYLHGVVWHLLPILWFEVLRNFVTALSRTRPIMVITVAAVGLKLVLTYTLVFGKFGFPALGVAGAGYGTSLVCWGMFGVLALYILNSHTLRSYRVFSRLKEFELPLCWKILRLGLPIAGIALVEHGMFSTISILMGVLGAVSLAANQIVLCFLDIGIVVAFAIGEAAAVRVAQGIGESNPGATRQSGYIAIALGALVMAFMAIMLWTVPEAIVSFFLDINNPANTEVLMLTVKIFKIAAIFQIFDGVQAITARALRGFNETLIPMWIAAVGYWVIGIPGGYILGFPLGLGGPGLWRGLAVGLAITAILLVWRFIQMLNRLNSFCSSE